MPLHDLSDWQHPHRFDEGNRAAERGTRWVVAITVATMLVEISAGWLYGSMALLADGVHMSSHAVAIGLSALAYAAARRLADDRRFAFGTWKIEVLAGFASAVLLMAVAAAMAVGSVERMLRPEPIQYPQALGIAALGLVVNLACAWILARAHPEGGHSGHGHGHGHGHTHGNGHGHEHAHGHAHGLDRAQAQDSGAHPAEDLNLRAAYVHVVADAATSVLALAALAGGWLLGWDWLDPVIGLAGAALIAWWARGLLLETGRVLLDREMDHPLVETLRTLLTERGAATGTGVADLHAWRVGRSGFACALTLVTHDTGLTAATVRSWLAAQPEVVHATIEIQRCERAGCVQPGEPPAGPPWPDTP